jgi:hypothetical protein
MSRLSGVSGSTDERDLDAGSDSRPESSPWWPITLTLAEIAEIVERRRAQEHTAEDAT